MLSAVLKMIFTTNLELPPTHHLLTIPKCYFPILQINMTLLVALEGIRIEERLATEGAHQPYSQMYLLYVSTDGSGGG